MLRCLFVFMLLFTVPVHAKENITESNPQANIKSEDNLSNNAFGELIGLRGGRKFRVIVENEYEQAYGSCKKTFWKDKNSIVPEKFIKGNRVEIKGIYRVRNKCFFKSLNIAGEKE